MGSWLEQDALVEWKLEYASKYKVVSREVQNREKAQRMFGKLARRLIKPSSQSCSISILANLGAKLSNVDIHRGQSTSLVVRGCKVGI